eukprot:m.149026 g.149026  ORF g.149026 m.149026 type:complete len:767 (-) comp15006_c0_seq20:1460-3760(-)
MKSEKELEKTNSSGSITIKTIRVRSAPPRKDTDTKSDNNTSLEDLEEAVNDSTTSNTDWEHTTKHNYGAKFARECTTLSLPASMSHVGKEQFLYHNTVQHLDFNNDDDGWYGGRRHKSQLQKLRSMKEPLQWRRTLRRMQNETKVHPVDSNAISSISSRDTPNDDTLQETQQWPSHQMPTLAREKTRGTDHSKRNKGCLGLQWYFFKLWIRDHIHSNKDPNPLWRRRIKRVEGKFGAGVATFFSFVRFILEINIIIMLIETAFVVVPAWNNYEMLPQVATEGLTPNDVEGSLQEANYTLVFENASKSFTARNVLDGGGIAGDSIMFFGGYRVLAGSYRMDVAYILTSLFLGIALMLTLMWLIFHSKQKSGSSLVVSHKKMPFTVAVLASWDYSLNGVEGVKNLRSGIALALQQSIRDRKTSRDEHLTRTRIMKRVIGWFIWALMMGSIFYGISELVFYDLQHEKDSIVSEYLLAGSISFINAVVPFFLKALVAFEDYETRGTEIYVEIARTFLLRVVGIYAILYGLIVELYITEQQYPEQLEGYRVVQNQCAGTKIGQEFYKLAIADVVFTIIMEFFFYYAARVALRELIEMDIAQSVIIICYRQGLIQIGMIFCPVIPVVGVLGAIFSFYLYYFLAFETCRPPKKGIRSVSSRGVHVTSLTLMLIFCSAPLLYIMRVYSPNCGAFAGYPNMFVGLELWTRDYESWRTFVLLLADPLILYVGIFILGSLLFYNRAVLRDIRWSNEELQHELLHIHRSIQTWNEEIV